jgi:hypothetical protein
MSFVFGVERVRLRRVRVWFSRFVFTAGLLEQLAFPLV